MLQLIILSCVIALVVPAIVVSRKHQSIGGTIIKFLTLFLFVAYGLRMYHIDAIEHSFNLFTVDVETPIDAFETWLFPIGKTVFILLLKWMTVVMVTWAMVAVFFKQRFPSRILAFIGLPVAVLNIVFFQDNLVALEGWDYSLRSFRVIQYMAENILFTVLMTLYLFDVFSKRLWPSLKEIALGMVIVFISVWALMPISIAYNLLGYYGEKPLDFESSHLFVIFFPFAVSILIYFMMRKQDIEHRRLLLMFLAFAAFFQYFSFTRTGLQNLPFHFCNAAIVILLVAIVWNREDFFYYTYFAGIIGGLAAIVLPNYNRDLFDMRVIHFGFNHLYVVLIPILGVALGVFPRPRLQQMLKALMVFAGYFLFAVFINAWFRNYQPDIDYFFTHSDFIPDQLTFERFDISHLYYDYYAEFSIGTHTFGFYYIFKILYFIGFVFLMFMTWYIYDILFQSFDRHRALMAKHQQIRRDQAALKKALSGRKLRDPFDPAAVGMMKIKNFSKFYPKTGIRAVDDFSLAVNSGEIIGFIGHNGAGKSTTIKSLVGIQTLTDGEMLINGYSVKSQPIMAKTNIGYVSDNHAVYEKMTGREYINYVGDLYGVSLEDRNTRMNDYLKRFNLDLAIDREVKSYSHGMKQKLVIIASLIHDPKIWILDEPLTGLDPNSSFQIKACMRTHAEKGNIVFFSSHVIEVVERICDRIVIINQGKLVSIYTREEIQTKNISLEKLYLTGQIA